MTKITDINKYRSKENQLKIDNRLRHYHDTEHKRFCDYLAKRTDNVTPHLKQAMKRYAGIMKYTHKHGLALNVNGEDR